MRLSQLTFPSFSAVVYGDDWVVSRGPCIIAPHYPRGFSQPLNNGRKPVLVDLMVCTYLFDGTKLIFFSPENNYRRQRVR